MTTATTTMTFTVRNKSAGKDPTHSDFLSGSATGWLALAYALKTTAQLSASATMAYCLPSRNHRFQLFSDRVGDCDLTGL